MAVMAGAGCLELRMDYFLAGRRWAAERRFWPRLATRMDYFLAGADVGSSRCSLAELVPLERLISRGQPALLVRPALLTELQQQPARSQSASALQLRRQQPS